LACACRAWIAAPPSVAPTTIESATPNRAFMSILQELRRCGRSIASLAELMLAQQL
jgi:hypothetical protein